MGLPVLNRIWYSRVATVTKIKSSLNSRYYVDACNKWREPSPRLSAWATQLRRSVAAVVSRGRRCADLTDPGHEPKTSPPIACALSN